ncbi:MAG TPA: TldD/PmbA family protein [Candidatus Binataceae bacterium]|nr:TldD/PmbA family protein [Candidatus Binataceae bacterium]
MASASSFESIRFLRENCDELMRRFARRRGGGARAELRFEASFSRASSASDGEARDAREGESAGFSVTVWSRAGRSGRIGMGQVGVEVGRMAQGPALLKPIAAAIDEAFERAKANARSAQAILGRASAHVRNVDEALIAPARAIRDQSAAVFQRDPRTLGARELSELCREASASIAGLGSRAAYNSVAALAELREELYANTDGSLITQAFAFSQGDCYVVAQDGAGHQESYDTIGQQRGFECIAEGWRDELMPNPDLVSFATELGREACELAGAPALKPTDAEVTVVTDPHFNALLAHEIVGHPSEADRALKMEAAYAGRSWLLRSLNDNAIGKRIGSPLLGACSDPGLNGYGHYRYDHEGTPGRRVIHIENGTYRGFLNSRATAAVLDVEPNGSARASEGYYVPLIRMSNTFFMPGRSDPERMIAEVDRGYYVCGSAIPSIAESRENFRISARRVYEIERGRIGRLYRAGSVISDSKRFFMNVDAVGNDLRLIAIPNCGKGQPMQVKRMSNGGPTLRSRARLGGG